MISDEILVVSVFKNIKMNSKTLSKVFEFYHLSLFVKNHNFLCKNSKK